MAIVQTPDGRWYVAGRKGYWPDEPERTKEYFGRGQAAERAARLRDAELGRRGDRHPPEAGPTFAELACAYALEKRFSRKSETELNIRLERIILPVIGHRRAIRLTHQDIDAYVQRRRAHITRAGTRTKYSTMPGLVVIY